jgi:hypothetical protein
VEAMMTVQEIVARKDGGGVVSTPIQLGLPVNVEQSGEMRLYKFVLPFLPPSKNVYDGWPVQWKQSAKKKWLRVIAEECEASMVPQGLGSDA